MGRSKGGRCESLLEYIGMRIRMIKVWIEEAEDGQGRGKVWDHKCQSSIHYYVAIQASPLLLFQFPPIYNVFFFEKKKEKISVEPTSISISDSVSLAWPALYRL